MAISRPIRAWLYLIPLIPSVLVAIFVLYHILSSRALRKANNNHVIIVLLVVGLIFKLTEVVWNIYFYFNSISLSSSNAFCLIWVFIGSDTLIIIFYLMAWASIERHILIFYPNLFATKKKCFYYHYLPLAICILYPTIFYFVMFFIVPCSTVSSGASRQCGYYGCIFNNSWGSKWDSYVNYIMPSFVAVCFSVALFVRVLYTRYRIRGRIDWKNYRKMAVQLLPISALYLLLQFPPMIMYAILLANQLPSNIRSNYYSDSYFFIYWAVFCTPFASALALPDLQIKCRNLLFCRKRGAVGPQTLTMVPRNVDQPVAVIPVVQ